MIFISQKGKENGNNRLKGE